MKTIFSLLLATTLLVGCKNDTKKKTSTETTTQATIANSFKYDINKASKNIGFTAYKTTEKVPVNGVFEKINVIKGGQSNETIQKCIEGTEFSIPLSSIETKDDSRNFKIRKFFFGVMKETLSLTGKINLKDDKNAIVQLKMNNIIQNIPCEYSIINNTFELKTLINIDKWNAQSAIKSLNTVCKDLHKGADGVSKTWNEVKIHIKLDF